MTQKFITSVDQPFALVRAQGNGQPGQRPATSVVWLEYQNRSGIFDGGEIWLMPHSGTIMPRGGKSAARRYNPARWRFSYKHPKQFAPEDVLYRFPHKRGTSSTDKTEHCGGPLLVEVRKAKKALPIIPEPEPKPIIDARTGQPVTRATVGERFK